MLYALAFLPASAVLAIVLAAVGDPDLSRLPRRALTLFMRMVVVGGLFGALMMIAG